MSTNSTAARWAARATGIAASSGALYILLRDAFETGHASTEQILTPIVVGVTIVSGHLVMTALREFRPLSAAGFAALFALGTGLTVHLSVGQQAKVAAASEGAADVYAAAMAEISSEHTATGARRTRAEGMLAEAQRKLAAECATGRGRRCDGIRATIEVYEAAIKGHDAHLAELAQRRTALGPEPSANPRAERIADVAALFDATADRPAIARAVNILEPFGMALFFELGAIVAFGFGFAPRRTPRTVPNRPAIPDRSPDKPARRASPPASPPASVRGRANGRTDKDDALAELVTQLALGRTFGSQDELAGRWGRSKSTVSDWLREWESAGLIPARRTAGRCKALSS